MKAVLITGISGSGKSIAIRTLEDDGFYCIDNLPARFLQDVLASLQSAGHERVAVSIDARSGEVGELGDMIAGLGQVGHDVKLLFLNASTDTLIHRYSETRRRHPLSIAAGDAGPGLTLAEAIALERETMASLQTAGFAIDTTGLHPNVLRKWVRDAVQSEQAPLTLLFESFAFKDGVPLNADLVFDVRCLPNPFYDASLKPLTGLDAPVRDFLEAIPAVRQMIDDIGGFLQRWVPSYLHENRSYLTVAIGCTGGQHRSVFVVEQLAGRLRDQGEGNVLVRHRAMTVRAHAAG